MGGGRWEVGGGRWEVKGGRCGRVSSPTPSSPPGLNLTYTLTCSGGGIALASRAWGSNRSNCEKFSRGQGGAPVADDRGRSGMARPKSVSRERVLCGDYEALVLAKAGCYKNKVREGAHDIPCGVGRCVGGP